MEQSLFLYVLSTVLVAGESISTCELWCRKPMSFEYVCCDDGNPYLTATQAVMTPQNASDIPPTTTSTKAPSVTEVMPTTDTCRYYCVYSKTVYCCDDGSNPVPEDHGSHDGRCPTKKEQVCKKGGIYLHVYAAKMTNKDGGRILSSKGKSALHPTCASDGYCKDDEKCCENICAKKHTCMLAVYDYSGGAKRTTIKKKKSSKRP